MFQIAFHQLKPYRLRAQTRDFLLYQMDQEKATMVVSSSNINESHQVSDNETIMDIKSVENVENTTMNVKNVGGEEASTSSDVNDGKLDDISSQRLCRICHLTALESGKSIVDLIEIGCGCIGELGFAHSHCAEAWFNIKGNRICEICGKIAKNINGNVQNRFMEEWNENGAEAIYDFESYENNRRCCWHGQSFCKFLMACLVIAFVLPWFFRVNMF